MTVHGDVNGVGDSWKDEWSNHHIVKELDVISHVTDQASEIIWSEIDEFVENIVDSNHKILKMRICFSRFQTSMTPKTIASSGRFIKLHRMPLAAFSTMVLISAHISAGRTSPSNCSM